MRIAGVRLPEGPMVWVDAGEFLLEPLDGVAVEVEGREFQGQVMVAPEALMRPVETSGRIVRVVAAETADAHCSDLPGADMPPLGTRVDGETVIAVDAVKRTVTLQGIDGTRNTEDVQRNS